MSKGALPMMNTRCTKLSMVRDDAKSSKTSNKKCPVVLHGDQILDASSVDYRLRIIESVYLKYDKQSLNTQEYSYPLKLV